MNWLLAVSRPLFAMMNEFEIDEAFDMKSVLEPSTIFPLPAVRNVGATPFPMMMLLMPVLRNGATARPNKTFPVPFTRKPAPTPTIVLSEALVPFPPAFCPINTFVEPVVFAPPALVPMNVLMLPVVFAAPADTPARRRRTARG